MIRLTKGPEPDVLTQNRETWTRDLLAAVEADDRQGIARITKRYNHRDVKSALKAETSDKCAYCEARVTDVAHGDIEHVTPKSLSPARTFDWNNLTFACQICNQKKSNKKCLDPYCVQPRDHIFFAGAFAKGKTTEGATTVLAMDLNRVALIESRNREIERYADRIQEIYLVNDRNLRKLLLNNISDQLATGKPEFVAACQSVIEFYRTQIDVEDAENVEKENLG